MRFKTETFGLKTTDFHECIIYKISRAQFLIVLNSNKRSRGTTKFNT